MTHNPYTPPQKETNIANKGSPKPRGKYETYDEVPYYRKQWFFWLMYFTIPLVAIALLLFGDIYYVKKGRVVSFGLANRIVAGIIAVFFAFRIISAFMGNS